MALDSASGRDPPDGGYGWVIVICFIMINTCVLPITQCFGIIYASKFAEMEISAAETSLLVHLNIAMMQGLGLISGPVFKRYNFRQVSLCGVTLVCLGTFLTAFARSYTILLCTFSLLIGIGQGILMPGLYIAVNSYFKKKLTLAVSFQVTGASLSNIFMPQICHYLLEQYGVQGTVLILAGISFNAIPIGLLIKPLEKKPISKVDAESIDTHVSERLLSTVYRETTIPATKNKRESKLSSIAKMLDLELFGNRVYVFIVIGMGISFVSEMNVVLMTPFILSELAGFDNKQVASAMSVQAFADIVGRLAIPILAYKANIHPKLMYISSLSIASLGRTLLASYYLNTSLVYFVSVLIGLAKGIKAVFQSVILPKYVSSEKLPSAIGLNMVLNGILSMIIGPFLGYTHDLGNSYVYPLHVATTMSMFCVALWAAEYLFCSKSQTDQAVALDTH